MGYRDRFTETEIVNLENQLLDAMGKSRENFKEVLWEDFHFVYGALPYFYYDSNFWILHEFVSEKFYDNMLVVCAILKNLQAEHNFLGIELVLQSIPKHAWYEQSFQFMHNVVCADVSALEYAPVELITADAIMNGIYQVPHQCNFCEQDYFEGYKKVISCAPKCLWQDEKFVATVKKAMNSTFTYINRLDDLEKILQYIDNKIQQ